MNMFTLFIVIAAAAVIVTLISGITAMAHNGEVGHRTSAEWMTWRVVLQAAAFGMILLVLWGQH